jgi:hypothetical protein
MAPAPAFFLFCLNANYLEEFTLAATATSDLPVYWRHARRLIGTSG